jgi:hypothetical protein
MILAFDFLPNRFPYLDYQVIGCEELFQGELVLFICFHFSPKEAG